MDSGDQETYQKVDAGAADTVQTQAGTIKKGGYCMLKGFPCKVSDYSTAKPGKHGSAKASIKGKDIFTGKTYEDSCPTAANIPVPIVKKTEYQLVDIDDDFAKFLDQNKEIKSIKLQVIQEDDQGLFQRLKDANSGDNQVHITILTAVGKEKVVDFREK